ncbi:MAG TPA: 16S rRNA (cytosine(1402)-N(4))-methyltransferase, partial [Rhizomicrobium sp.]|nr:16S rRNA (cytosine(1402)-N(4))-methyltransferase [Rhizomicrobium sp.]
RIVKQFLAQRSGKVAAASRHAPERATRKPAFKLLGSRPRSPGEGEIDHNPRARSARLRAAERLAA